MSVHECDSTSSDELDETFDRNVDSIRNPTKLEEVAESFENPKGLDLPTHDHENCDGHDHENCEGHHHGTDGVENMKFNEEMMMKMLEQIKGMPREQLAGLLKQMGSDPDNVLGRNRHDFNKISDNRVLTAREKLQMKRKQMEAQRLPQNVKDLKEKKATEKMQANNPVNPVNQVEPINDKLNDNLDDVDQVEKLVEVKGKVNVKANNKRLINKKK